MEQPQIEEAVLFPSLRCVRCSATASSRNDPSAPHYSIFDAPTARWTCATCSADVVTLRSLEEGSIMVQTTTVFSNEMEDALAIAGGSGGMGKAEVQELLDAVPEEMRLQFIIGLLRDRGAIPAMATFGMREWEPTMYVKVACGLCGCKGSNDMTIKELRRESSLPEGTTGTRTWTGMRPQCGRRGGPDGDGCRALLMMQFHASQNGTNVQVQTAMIPKDGEGL